MIARWVMVHGRTTDPGYRYVCTTHWTYAGAVSLAASMQRAADEQGYAAALYWAERRRPGDVPGHYTVDEVVW